MSLRSFSDEDLEILRWVIGREKARYNNELEDEPPNIPPSPDVLIADEYDTLVKESGDDALYHAKHQIYQISNQAATKGEPVAVANYFEDVYHLPSDKRLVFRDRYGRWLEQTSVESPWIQLPHSTLYLQGGGTGATFGGDGDSNQSTIEWNSASVIGDLSGSPVTVLSCSSYGDPAVKLEVGLWLMQIEAFVKELDSTFYDPVQKIDFYSYHTIPTGSGSFPTTTISNNHSAPDNHEIQDFYRTLKRFTQTMYCRTEGREFGSSDSWTAINDASNSVSVLDLNDVNNLGRWPLTSATLFTVPAASAPWELKHTMFMDSTLFSGLTGAFNGLQCTWAGANIVLHRLSEDVP